MYEYEYLQCIYYCRWSRLVGCVEYPWMRMAQGLRLSLPIGADRVGTGSGREPRSWTQSWPVWP